MRKFVKYEISDLISFKEKLLHYAKNFSRCCVLNSNEWRGNTGTIDQEKYEMIAAVDFVDELISGDESRNSFDALHEFYKEKNDWLFGFFSYDLKDEVEILSSPSNTKSVLCRTKKPDGIGFPLMHFFRPKYVFILRGNKLEIGFLPGISTEEEVKNIFQEIIVQLPIADCRLQIAEIKPRVPKEEYISTIKKIKRHIHRGDIYEMNCCMEFFSSRSEIDPAEVFLRLNETSQTPFSAFYRMDDNYLLCASPERFLKKEGRKIISQPIKGTTKRGKNDAEDIELKKMLSQNEKEKSENVMIVDLVRNDLSKTCDSVRVDELFGIYTFRQWHQMISTVSGEMRENIRFTDVIKNAFPMGSMTGAPKIRAMELIEQYEKTKRGLYSGALGYISAEGNFDLNVVIRSILYNASSKYVSFQVGSAITANSTAENEYEECLLKAKGMFEALTTNANDALKVTDDELNAPTHA